MTENAITIHRPTWSEIQRIGEDFYKSGMFTDVRNAMQAIVKIQAGNELGLPPFASISGINIIQGKAVLGANLIATLIKNDPRYNYRITKSTDESCEIEFYEGGEAIGSASFTIKEAQAAGLAGKDNWKKYPSDMLFARAISRGSRRHTPGIFGGAPVYTPDEIGVDTDQDGYVESSFVEEPRRPATEILADLGEDPEPTAVNGGKRKISKATVEEVVKAGHADNLPNAVNMLKLSNLTGEEPLEATLNWCKTYRAARDEGLTTDEAAKFANDSLAQPALA